MRSAKTAGVFCLFSLLVILAACRGTKTYVETFDEEGSWRTGSDTDVDGKVADGVFDFYVKADEMVIWTTAGEEFGDGTYQVEATQVEGPLDNGYGMMFRVDDKKDDFYLFEVSGDGYVWIGRYKDGGDTESEPIIGSGWIEDNAVNQGLEAKNTLTVRAESGNLIFLVNDTEVGRVTDNSFNTGDIGLLVRTLGMGGVRVRFDNFTVTPLEKG